MKEDDREHAYPKHEGTSDHLVRRYTGVDQAEVHRRGTQEVAAGWNDEKALLSPSQLILWCLFHVV